MSDPAAPKARKTPTRRRKPAAKKANDTAAVAASAPSESAQATQQESQAPVALIRVPLSVRWRDLDAFNHVNNSKYLSFLEEARLRWMLSVPGQGLDDHVAPVVAAANLNYRRPIEWPAEVDIELFVERLGSTSLTIGHRILDAKDETVLYCDGNVVMVWIDRNTGRAAQLPEAVRTACS
ncbi:acyl-CoA thioesterase [Lysobacter sp. MMG2]|nr:acyl-CoA thioesterase [Lysobacter sp. MMG2]